jgi:general secretion pathway protein D
MTGPVATPTVQQTGNPAPARQDSVSVRVVNVELRTAVQLLGQYLDRPVLFSGQGGGMVTLESPRPVPRGDVVRLLRGLLDSQNFELVDDTASRIYRARPKETARSQATPTSSPAANDPRGTVEMFVIRLQHARAPDVAGTVNSLFGRTEAAFEPGSRRQTLGEELRANQVPPAGAAPPQAVPGASGRSATLTGDVTIVPDTRGNSLLIRANRHDFSLIEAAVKQLDVRPLQVLIEVMIAEVRRDRGRGFGASALSPPGVVRGTDDVTIGGTLHGVSSAAGLGDFVLKVMGLGGMNVETALRIAANRGDVNIVSRPVVITANNEEAQIVVGSQRPFVQVARSLPTDQSVRDEIVQYKDVGTKLAVRPTVSTDGAVQLEVMQEVSSATGETSFNAPVISTRSVQTHLLVQDGQTVALGGLTDRQKDVTRSGIPVLSWIPIIGGLFGHQSHRTIDTELFIFLTPRVIRTDDDAARLSDPLRTRALRPKAQGQP